MSLDRITPKGSKRSELMLRAGCVLSTIWAVLNLVPSVVIVVSTLFFGGHTPALRSVLSEAEIDALSPGALATLDSIAVFANGTNIAFCLLVLAVIWMGLHRRRRWAFWALLGGLAMALAAGVGADYAVGFAAPWVNWISGCMLGVALACSAVGLFRDEPQAVAKISADLGGRFPE